MTDDVSSVNIDERWCLLLILMKHDVSSFNVDETRRHIFAVASGGHFECRFPRVATMIRHVCQSFPYSWSPKQIC